MKAILLTKKTVFWSLVLILITIFTYKDIFNLFYQQDEWQTIGNNIILNNFLEVFADFNLLNFISVQERFASNALAYLLMGKFAFNTVLMGVYSLFFHLINTILVFTIIRKWVVKDNLFAILGGIFFAISDVSISAVSWFGTSLGTLPATTLILFALASYFYYIELRKKKFILITLALLYVSFFFKEIGIFLLLFLPLASLLFLKYSKKEFFYTYWPFFAVFFLVFSIRIVNLVFLSDRSGELFVTAKEESFISSIFTRLIMYPLTSFSLTFIPPEPFVSFAKYFTNNYYPFVSSEHFNLIAQTIVIDVFAVFLTLVILFVSYLLIKSAPIRTKKIMIFWILFFALSFLPYVLLAKSFAYLESRYYYLASLPAGVLLGFLGFSLQKSFGRVNFGILVIISSVIFLAAHMRFLKSDLSALSLVSHQRISFFSQLKELKPTLRDNKNVFFLAGNHDYYVPGNNVPFQQGMGYTFMISYYSSGKIPKDFIRDRFLWDLNTQGYREINNTGFGFFTDKKLLEETIRKHHLTDDQITILYYDSGAQRLLQID